MKTDEIKLMYEYNDWADQRILAACAKVGPEQYAAPANFGTGYGSLRATLVHLVDGAWLWRRLFEGDMDFSKELTEADLPTLDALEKRWQEEQQALRAYIDGLTDEDLNGILRYTLPSGTVRERVLWHCLLHLVNHGTQHRSEAAALCTSYGQSPGDFDFTLFLNERLSLPD